MRDTVLYLRGPFPFGPDQSINERFINDAKLLLLPTENQIKSLATALSTFAGFLDTNSLEALVEPCLPDPALAPRAVRFILAIDERRRLPGFDINDLPGQIANWLRENKQDVSSAMLSPSDVELLSSRLPLLFKSIPGLDRQAKARSLSERTGQPLERLEMICDLRPIFDTAKDAVEGMIPFTTLRLVCKGVDGLPIAFDALLSERDVFALAKASRDAKKKLLRLRQLLANAGVAIPEIEATKQVAGDGDEE